MTVTYTVENGELVVHDRRGARYVKPDGRRVEKAVKAPTTDDAFVLLRWYEDDPPVHVPNLVRVGPDGAIKWQAMPPDREQGVADFWVDFRVSADGGLSANSWSCFYCTLDPESGAVTSETFTK